MSEQEELQDEGQPLVEHLLELRSRLLNSVLVVLIVFLPLFYVAGDIYAFISEPLRQYLPEGTTMIATEVASPFLVPFKLALILPCLSPFLTSSISSGASWRRAYTAVKNVLPCHF